MIHVSVAFGVERSVSRQQYKSRPVVLVTGKRYGRAGGSALLAQNTLRA
jgi:hypothetical protein